MEDQSVLYNIISVIGDRNKTDQILTLIRSEYGSLKNDIDTRLLLSDLRFNKEQTELKNPSIAWIEKKIFYQEDKIKNERQPLSTDKSEIVVIENKLSFISNSTIKDEMENTLFKHWINDVFSSKEYDKEKISDDATTKAKESIKINGLIVMLKNS
jgi:hypothetical protein